MKKSFKLLLLTVLALICALMFTSCGESEPSSENPTSKDDGKTIVLNVFNWGEYISDGFEGSLDSVAEFEDYYFEKFGKKVKVNYSTYATNEDMYSKLTSGAGSYDIVVPSDYMIDRLIEENWLLPFDASTIENYKYIDDEFKNLYFDNTLTTLPVYVLPVSTSLITASIISRVFLIIS